MSRVTLCLLGLAAVTPGVPAGTEPSGVQASWLGVSSPAAFVEFSPMRLDVPAPCLPIAIHMAELVRSGQPVGGLGNLSFPANTSAANVNGLGSAAFFALTTSPLRTHGIFVADGFGARPIVVGCGAGGGSGETCTTGDPAPIGGHFSGIFDFTPAFNSLGDVLFLADVAGGSAPRGLFLYTAGNGRIIKVVAIGDPTPTGGTITALGLGSLNRRGDVVCLAETSAAGNPVNMFLWQDGVLRRLLAVGDPAPWGGTFSRFAREFQTFPDRTRVYTGSIPGINGARMILCYAETTGGPADRGILDATAWSWWLRAGDTTPTGGTYVDFGDPLVAEDAGVIAVSATIRLPDNRLSTAWTAGEPGYFHSALAIGDPLDGGTVIALGASHNPLNAVDFCANVALWCRVQTPGGPDRDYVVYSRSALGIPMPVAREGDPTPLGGTYGPLSPWPCLLNHMLGTFGAATPGSGTDSAFFRYQGQAPGDLNCDGMIDFDDINPFVLALTDPAGYAANYPQCDIRGADANFDGRVDFDDINPFVALISPMP